MHPFPKPTPSPLRTRRSSGIPSRLKASLRLAGLLWLLPAAPQSSPAGAPPAPPTLAIVVHKDNPTTDLSREQLRRMLLLEHREWANGRRVTVALLPSGTPERKELLQTICRLTEAEFERHLLQQTFAGQSASRPKELANAANLKRFIFNAPGALGCLPATDADASVKILRIDGKLPGEPGYPLAASAP